MMMTLFYGSATVSLGLKVIKKLLHSDSSGARCQGAKTKQYKRIKKKHYLNTNGITISIRLDNVIFR